MNHFSKATVKALARKGVTVMGTTVIPDMSSEMPYANGATGYRVNDNGTGRVLRFSEVLDLAVAR